MDEVITDDTLSDLHQKKQSAINALDFETAKYYYNEIQVQISKRAKSQIDDIRHETIHQLHKIQSDHKIVLENLVEEKRKADARLYTKFQVLFQETQDDQIKQLMNLEKDRGLTLLEESEREIPEQIELLNQAKDEAFLSHFEKAIELRQRSREIGTIELERRRKEVEAYYEDLKQKMLIRHKSELDQISELHEKELIQLKERADMQNEDAKRQLNETIDLLKDHAIVRIQALTSTDFEKKTAIDSLIAEITQSMSDYNEMPTVVPELTKSEQMRLWSLCQTNAAMNMKNTEDLVRRAEAKTPRPTTSRTGLRTSSRPPSHSSTKLISRAHTATIGKR